MRATPRKASGFLGLVMLSVLALTAPPPAQGLPSRSTCFITYVGCMETAANESTFIRRTAAGMDCYVDLATCIRTAIFG